MKRKLILLLSVVALMLPQTMTAQEKHSFILDFHEKYSNPNITQDAKPEEIIEAILDGFADGDNYMLWEDTWLEVQRKVTDRYGNVHVTYNQRFNPTAYSAYQLVLHFRPDGSLYYRNGTIAFENKESAQNAKSRKPANKISAERAAVIATGSPMSESVRTVVTHKGEVREAYKVTDMARMQDVYVDAYSGDVLFTISLIQSFASWKDVKGSVVTLPISTTYEGMQEFIAMQTDKGIVLRDPTRNIITVDATGVLADRDSTNTPERGDEQLMLLMDSCSDMVFADKAELLNQKYTTNVKSLTIWLDPEMEKVPESLYLKVVYTDEDYNYVKDFMEMDFNDVTWIDDNGRKKCTITFEDRPSINLLDHQHYVRLLIDGELYDNGCIICPGNKNGIRMYKGDDLSNVACCFDVEVDARQMAIDVHWALQKIYDMYEEYYGIKGCDGEGSQIVNVVNPYNNMPITGTLPANAFAYNLPLFDSYGERTFIMCYGAGRADLLQPQSSFDTAAHEFTHNMTAGCCNTLLYQNESGALNEALADCMAMVAEHYVWGESDWVYCDKSVMGGDNIRSLSNPWYSFSKDGNINDDFAQPKYYGGRFWLDYTKMDPKNPIDNGGVHTNSGVFNHLFYLLCEGGMGVKNEWDETLNLEPVGIDRMKDILFHDMRYYNACLCSYEEIADNLLMAVEDLYGNSEEAVKEVQTKFLDAYSHVGMQSYMFPTGIKEVSTPLKSTSTSPRLHLDSNGRIVIEKGGRVYNVAGGRMK